MPKPFEEVWRESEGFREKWNFPNAIAAIDGKHVDANYKFIVVDIGAFGKNSLRNSNLVKGLQNVTLNIPSQKYYQVVTGSDVLPHVIIGDEVFPLCLNLMQPYSREDALRNEEKKVFNYRLSRARNTVENTFGILPRKFRIFERKMSMSQELIVSVVMVTCCLHNFLRNDACHWTENDLNISISNMRRLQDLKNIGENSKTDALAVRDRFKSYFNSAAGSVEWQLSRV
ncbi:uncharacterized protein LOC126897372 [Daktulosphaira vitifoliae]|uniref:uncharacterized protein LOC126897372 n=1 Tax=Daktulosphaira vitifoliae TaxID=58002 RepID=UPI0021AA7BF6|nr:uncharacterized protein LOC126897372 [Daktulosphaira vitifoliae]